MAVAALLGIGTLLGWVPQPPTGTSPANVAAPSPMTGSAAPADSLSPGETLVTAPEPSKPVAPRYATEPKPTPPVAPPENPSGPDVAPKPRAPVYAAPTLPKSPAATRPRGLCANCGIVTATATIEDAGTARVMWEVRVKFGDDTRRVLRYPTDPEFRVGEKVILANGRLLHDY